MWYNTFKVRGDILKDILLSILNKYLSYFFNEKERQEKLFNKGIKGIYTDFGEAKMVDDWKVK